MKLPAKPPAWLDELSAYITEEKAGKFSLASVKKHWADFRTRKQEAEEEEGKSGEKRPRPTPEESLGKAVGKLTKKKKDLDLGQVIDSVRENSGDDAEQNMCIFKSIGSGLGATESFRELYQTFEARAAEQDVSDDVRDPVKRMVTMVDS